jgi:hypothetical protein
VSVLAVKVPLGELPVASTSFTSDVDAVTTGGAMTLRFTFPRGGVTYRGGVRFEKVRASRWRTESLCSAWHIEGAYDTIAEVEGSEWVEELQAAEPDHHRGFWTMRHFMLYIDSAGCFEAVAGSWALLEEEPV